MRIRALSHLLLTTTRRGQCYNLAILVGDNDFERLNDLLNNANEKQSWDPTQTQGSSSTNTL